VVSDKHPHHSGVEETDPDTWSTVMVGVIGTILVVTAVVFLQGLFDSGSQAEFRRKVVDEAPRELQALRVKQLEKLSSQAWVDQARGVVTIPLDRAMELWIADPTLAPVAVPDAPPPAPAAVSVAPAVTK
jgi:hypothetical protein